MRPPPHQCSANTLSITACDPPPFARSHIQQSVAQHSTGGFSLAHNTRPHMHPPTDTDAPTPKHAPHSDAAASACEAVLRLFRKSAYWAHVSHATPSAQAQRGGTAGVTHLVPPGSVWHFCAGCRWRCALCVSHPHQHASQTCSPTQQTIEHSEPAKLRGHITLAHDTPVHHTHDSAKHAPCSDATAASATEAAAAPAALDCVHPPAHMRIMKTLLRQFTRCFFMMM